MNSKMMMGGEGASTIAFGPSVPAMPGVVVSPACVHGSITFEAAQEIYRLAYESCAGFAPPERV